MTNRFEDIIAWQKARVFINHVYRVTKAFPDEEKFGLVSQFQRAAVSIAANIAEGYKRLGQDDKIRFFNYSQGSLEECRCFIYLANDFSYITADTANQLIEEIEETSRVLNAYINTMATKKRWED
jgi:four helix bundle protein